MRDQGGACARLPPGSGELKRPDAAAGVFETIQVRNGRLLEWRGHRERLRAAVHVLYGWRLPPIEPAARAAIGAAPGAAGRLRIRARPAGGHLAVEAEFVAEPPAAAALDLLSVQVEAGLGAFKWLDRSGIAAERERLSAGPEQQLLFVSTGGSILETERCNVLAIARGRIRVPSSPGEWLHGIALARVLRLARRRGVAVDPNGLSAGDLVDADQVLLCNSLIGLRAARSLDGRLLAQEDTIGARLSADLEAYWDGT